MAKIGVLHVTTTKKPPCRTKVRIDSFNLAEAGFVSGLPVIATQQLNGFTLVLQDIQSKESICKTSKLIHVGLNRDKPTITVNFAKNFFPNGLSTGDFLATKYEKGVIIARKLPYAQKYYVVTTQNYGAFLRLNGAWLSDAGFIPDDIVLVLSKPGNIILRAWKDNTKSHIEIVKFARTHKCQIMQVQANQHITYFDLNDYILSRANFEAHDIIGVHYEYGTITLFKPDLKPLGFER